MTFEEWLEKFKAEESYHAELIEGDHEYAMYAAYKAGAKDVTERAAGVSSKHLCATAQCACRHEIALEIMENA